MSKSQFRSRIEALLLLQKTFSPLPKPQVQIMKIWQVPQLLKDNHHPGKSSPQENQRSGQNPATPLRAMIYWICKVSHFALSVCVKMVEHAILMEKEAFVSACLDSVGNIVKMTLMNASRTLVAMELHALMG